MYTKLKNRLSGCLKFWHADNSAVYASIETGLPQNHSCVFKEHKVYFYKPTEPTEPNRSA